MHGILPKKTSCPPKKQIALRSRRRTRDSGRTLKPVPERPFPDRIMTALRVMEWQNLRKVWASLVLPRKQINNSMSPRNFLPRYEVLSAAKGNVRTRVQDPPGQNTSRVSHSLNKSRYINRPGTENVRHCRVNWYRWATSLNRSIQSEYPVKSAKWLKKKS